MLRSEKKIMGYRVHASDGEVGRIHRLYFDDEAWTVRYMLVETAKQSANRYVLVSPVMVKTVDDGRGIVALEAKREKITGVPRADITRPITRSYEKVFYAYHGLPEYWGGRGRWGDDLYPSQLFTVAPPVETSGADTDDLHETPLRSTQELREFAVLARDTNVGQVEDFLVHDMSWALEYIVVSVDALQPEKRILLSPRWIDTVSMTEKLISFDIPVLRMKDAPAFDPSADLNEVHDTDLFAYYERAEMLEESAAGHKKIRG